MAKKVIKKAEMGTSVGPKAKMQRPDSRMLKEVSVKRKPTTREVIESKMGPLSKPFASDSTSKMKKGGKLKRSNTMAKAIKKAAMGIDVKPKIGQKAPTKSKPLDKPTKRYKTPAGFYPESYDKRFPRTPGGGDNYGESIKYEAEQKAKGLLKKGGKVKKYKMGGAMAKQAATAIAMKKAGKTPKKK